MRITADVKKEDYEYLQQIKKNTRAPISFTAGKMIESAIKERSRKKKVEPEKQKQ